MGLLKKHSAKSVNYFSAHLKDALIFYIFTRAPA